jgi:hypothetical protein
MPWLELATLGSLRYDRHPRDSDGVDSGTLGQAAIVARSGLPLGGGFWVGGDLRVTFPGSERFSESLKSPVLDLRSAIGRSERRLRYAAVFGYRSDHSANAADDASRYRFGDRLVLGASDFDALLFGVAVAVPFRHVEWFGELSLDWLIGQGSPKFSQSPARVDLGLRRKLTARLSAEVLGELVLSGRPSVSASAPLVPVEPRLLVALGLRYHFDLNAAPAVRSAEPAAPIRPAAVGSASARSAPPPPEPHAELASPAPGTAGSEPAAVVPRARATVTVVDSAGHPLSDATVLFVSSEGTLALPFDHGSTFVSDQLPSGAGRLIVRADMMRDWERPIELSRESNFEIRVALIAADASGQIRGQVRSFDGKGLPASILVEPGHLNVEANADGSFSLDVAPGKYVVAVEVAGYRAQKRTVVVRRNGVLVLNLDLERQRP